jgi:hypothetical protein
MIELCAHLPIRNSGVVPFLLQNIAIARVHEAASQQAALVASEQASMMIYPHAKTQSKQSSISSNVEATYLCF